MCGTCEIRKLFGDQPKPECVLKSAVLKSGRKDKEPYYVTLSKFYRGLEL